MRIDFYISSLSGGGAEHVLTNLAAEFFAHGHEVSITSLEKRPRFYAVVPGVEVCRVDNGSRCALAEFLSDLRCLRRRLRSRRADVSIAFLSRCNLLLSLAALFTQERIVVCDRNNVRAEHSLAVFLLSCLLYLRADAVCIQTARMRASYPAFLRRRIRAIPNPVDLRELEAQCDWKSVEKEDVVVAVGRLERQKDFRTLIRAFNRVRDSFPSWTLKIFGRGRDETALRDLIVRLGGEGRIRLCGLTDKPFRELCRSRIFVLSSRYEGFPNVLVEAMAAGLPCISTDCRFGPAELISDGRNGFLLPVGDVDAMAGRLSLLMEDAQLRERLGRRARESADRLNIGDIYGMWERLVLSVSQGRGVSPPRGSRGGKAAEKEG